MDIAGKSVEQPSILERTKDDKLARRDLLPREILGKFAERLLTDPRTTTTDFSRMADVEAARLVAEKDAGDAAILALMGRVHLDRDAKRLVLAWVVNSKGYPKMAK